MDKKPFTPPAPHIDPPSQETIEKLSKMSKKEWRKKRKSLAEKKYIQPVLERERKMKNQKILDWWKDNWVSFLSMLFALIAAIPVIIQAISAILELLG